MRILVVNDDSIHYKGIKILARVAKKFAKEVVVVAPNTEKSAFSHSITTRKGIELYKHNDFLDGVEAYSITGTPADCVKFAVGVLKYNFDLVLSGVNKGYNLADDICYSGTASAALEAEFYEKKGIAFSVKYNNDAKEEDLEAVLKYLFASDIYNKSNVFNVNIPQNNRGIKITIQGRRRLKTNYILKEDGLYYPSIDYNIGSDIYINRNKDENDDFIAVENGYISITPLTNNKTNQFNKLV